MLRKDKQKEKDATKEEADVDILGPEVADRPCNTRLSIAIKPGLCSIPGNLRTADQKVLLSLEQGWVGPSLF